MACQANSFSSPLDEGLMAGTHGAPSSHGGLDGCFSGSDPSHHGHTGPRAKTRIALVACSMLAHRFSPLIVRTPVDVRLACTSDQSCYGLRMKGKRLSGGTGLALERFRLAAPRRYSFPRSREDVPGHHARFAQAQEAQRGSAACFETGSHRARVRHTGSLLES